MMHWVVLAGAFVILWFLALQIILPIGVRAPHETGEVVTAGTDPGAPSLHGLGVKLAAATLLAGLVWAIFYALVAVKILDL